MMRSRGSHVRSKIVFLLASMVALWAFAAVVTVREGLNLLFVNTVGEFGVTTSEVVTALQSERRLSVAAVSGSQQARGELATAREQTDAVLAGWRDDAASRSLRVAASDQLLERIGVADRALGALPELRASVDEQILQRREVSTSYTDMIDLSFDIFGAMAVLDDQEIARQSRALVSLSVAGELLAQQDALLAGALASGRMDSEDVADFVQLVGAQRFMLHEVAATDLAPEDRALFDQAVEGPAVQDLRAMEDQIIRDARAGQAPPVTADRWQATVAAAAGELRGVELAASDNVLQRAVPVAAGVILRLVLAGGLGMVAVVAAIVVSITTARALVRQLERLRDAARDLADHRLPRVVDRLSHGEQVDVATEAPPLRFGNDEIGQVGQAFNAVQETAVRAAVQQAELRHGVRDVFLSLARRTQSLVHKQLGVVDAMERRETDADELEDLFKIDHLATRMRRNAENLIILSGATPGRTWRAPVQMIDVIRGAIGETEDYQRVNLMPVQDAAIEGRVVGDVIHLLAELIENAASFSPPYAMVGVGGQRVAHGFVVEIEDRGLGMAEEELAEVNRKLADPPDFSLADASRLGHYVVAKLAQRHGIRVHLRTSPYGGVTAIVLVPQELLADNKGTAVAGAPAPAEPALAEPVSSRPAPSDSRPAKAAVRSTTPVVGDGQPMGVREMATNAAGMSAVEPVIGQPEQPALPVRPSGKAAVPRQRASSPSREEATAVERHDAAAAGVAAPSGSNGTVAAPGGSNGSNGAAARTPAGLPWRVRQASLPKQLWDEEVAEEPPARDPDEVRRAMSSYQLGTQRGRSAAAGPTHRPIEESPGAQPGEREEG